MVQAHGAWNMMQMGHGFMGAGGGRGAEKATKGHEARGRRGEEKRGGYHQR